MGPVLSDDHYYGSILRDAYKNDLIPCSAELDEFVQLHEAFESKLPLRIGLGIGCLRLLAHVIHRISKRKPGLEFYENGMLLVVILSSARYVEGREKEILHRAMKVYWREMTQQFPPLIREMRRMNVSQGESNQMSG